MSGFTLFKRGECPICSGATKGCRQSNTTDLIFCRDAGSNPTDYLYRGEDSWGFNLWQYKDDADTFSQKASEEKQQRRREFLEAESRRRQQQIAQQLPAVERDKWYCKLLDQLTLTEADREKLLERGFTLEQITRDGYRSVAKFEKVGTGYPLNLPGILSRGFGSNQILNVGGDGILCPIRDQNGLIVSCQLRLHDCTNGRYRWLTSATKKNPDGATSHLNLELPLGVFSSEEFRGDSIWFTEGTGIKPSLTRYHLGVPVVGAAAGLFDKSPETAKAAVEYLCTKYQTKILTFAIDAGDVINESGVPERWLSQFEFFQGQGYQCRVAWWGQVTKEHDDIDELTDASIIKHITPDEFWRIVEEYKNEVKHNLTSGISTSQSRNQEVDSIGVQQAGDGSSCRGLGLLGGETICSSSGGIDIRQSNSSSPRGAVDNDSQWDQQKWNDWVNNRKFTPDIKLNQEKFRFGNVPDSNAIIAVKSGLGTGKTEALLEIIKSSNRGVIILGYRNNLLFQTIDRAAQIGLNIYHLREDDGHALVADDSIHQALCLDSIRHVDGYFKGRDIYLDETCSVLQHATSGGTLGENQAKAIKILTRALEVANRVFLLDGNLSNIHVDFIAKLAPHKQVIKIENQRKISPHTIKFIVGVDIEGEVKKRDKSALLKTLCGDDIIPWISSDSKELTKVIDKLLKKFGRVGFVLNAETAGEGWAKEFLANPNKFIEEKKPGYFIISPTAESGVSVTINGYFTHKFSFFTGVQGTNSQHQQMFRLRDSKIPHYVFCPERSMVRDRSNPRTYAAKKFMEELDDRIVQSAILASQDSDSPERILEVIADAISRNHKDWWWFSCRLGSSDNFEMDNLKKCLIYALQDAGHDVEVIQWDIDEEFKAREKTAKEAVQAEHAQELFAAVEYDSIDEAKKIQKTNPRKETQRRIEKTYLLDRIPGIQETDIWNANFIYEHYIKDREFITIQQRFWLLNNFAVSQKRHEVDWYYKATNEDFFSASMKRVSHLTIWALKELNILQFLEGEWYKDMPQVVEFIEKARQPEIAQALRMQPGAPRVDGKERIEFIKNLLAMIGLKFKKQSQKLIDGIKQRVYAVDAEAMQGTARLAVLAAVERKFTKWMSEKSQVDWSEQQLKEPTPMAAGEATVTDLKEVVAPVADAEGRAVVNEATTVVISDQSLATSPAVIWEPLEASVVCKVDQEIKASNPLCDLKLLDQISLWTRRLNRAEFMGDAIARAIYSLVPQEILEQTWQQLTQGLQHRYIELFASG